MSKTPEEYFQEQSFSVPGSGGGQGGFSAAELTFIRKYMGIDAPDALRRLGIDGKPEEPARETLPADASPLDSLMATLDQVKPQAAVAAQSAPETVETVVPKNIASVLDEAAPAVSAQDETAAEEAAAPVELPVTPQEAVAGIVGERPSAPAEPAAPETPQVALEANVEPAADFAADPETVVGQVETETLAAPEAAPELTKDVYAETGLETAELAVEPVEARPVEPGEAPAAITELAVEPVEAEIAETGEEPEEGGLGPVLERPEVLDMPEDVEPELVDPAAAGTTGEAESEPAHDLPEPAAAGAKDVAPPAEEFLERPVPPEAAPEPEPVAEPVEEAVTPPVLAKAAAPAVEEPEPAPAPQTAESSRATQGAAAPVAGPEIAKQPEEREKTAGTGKRETASIAEIYDGMDIQAALDHYLRNEQELQMVAFYLGEQEFTVPTVIVQEVIHYSDPAKLPVAPPFVAGVINLRGKVTPLVYLRDILEVKQGRQTDDRFIIICRFQGLQVGLIIERVHTMYRVPQTDIDWGIEAHLGINVDFVSGLLKLNERLIGIVSVDKIVTSILQDF